MLFACVCTGILPSAEVEELVNTNPCVGEQPKFIFNTFASREEISQMSVHIYPSICTHFVFQMKLGTKSVRTLLLLLCFASPFLVEEVLDSHQ